MLAGPAWLLAGPSAAAFRATRHAAIDALILPAERGVALVLEGATPAEAATRLLADPSFGAAAARLQEALLQLFAAPTAAFVVLALLWHAGFERSSWRGTPGKRALGLSVVQGTDAHPPSWRSAWRFVAGAASWLTLNLGHAMAALPPRHLALHDCLSGTRVVARNRALPGWAKVWLAAQGVLFVVLNVLLLYAVDAAVRTALERVLIAG